MALRRLLSGWLIAVAALARSMALVLERAAADRSQPTPNSVPGPVMAALAERYPGAPDHWLALVAERTSRLADVGEAPLSLSSQPSVWPSSLPGATGPLAPLMPTPPAGDAAAPREPPRPVVNPTPRPAPQNDAVPSLSALQGRSSEVWRRPQVAQGRRPRPVFAPVEPAPSRPASTSESDAPTGRRPRSPLTLEVRAPSGPAADPPMDPPGPVAPSSKSVVRARSWSDGKPPGVEEQAEKALAWLPPQPLEPERAAGPEAVRRPEPGEPQGELQEGPPIGRSASRSLFAETSATASAVRDTSAFQSPVDAPPRRAAPPSADRPIVLDAAPPERPAFTPSPARSTVRRSIFKALAGLRDRARVSSVHHHQAAMKPAPSGPASLGDMVSPADRGARSSAPRPDLSQPVIAAPPAPHVRVSEGDDPPTRAEPRAVAAPTPRAPSPTWAPSFAAGAFANDEAPRDPSADFAISRPPSARVGAPRTTGLSIDDRWPKFPPTVFAPPLVAEIPSPRLDQLAREQEEGRWSV